VLMKMESLNTTVAISYGENTADASGNLHFEMILFQNQKKLRSHTFKHLLDENEFSNRWKRFTTLSLDDISKAHVFLSQIECPAQKNSNKACESDCPVYNQCSYMMDLYEKEYCKAIESILVKSMHTPLFSVFDSNETNGQFLVCLNNRSIVAKAAKNRNGKFNLVTCYANNVSGECYVEFRRRNVTKIRFEAVRGVAQWYSKETWGFAKKTTPKKEKNRQIPYQSGGSANYKQYLEGAFD